MSVSCPKCRRSVPEKRTCFYCGAPLTSAPGSVFGKDCAAWLAEGARVAELRQFERALGCFERALEVDPKSVPAHFNRALALAKLERLDEAKAAAERCLALAPNDAEVRRLLQELLSGPKALDAWLDEARAAARRRDFPAALQGFTRATQLDPKCVAGWLGRAMAFLDLGQPLEAMGSLDRALGVDPAHEDALRYRAQLKAGRMRFPPGVPPGRPGKTGLEAASSREPAEVYAFVASTRVMQRLGARPEDIAVVNWFLEVPDARGSPWQVGLHSLQGIEAQLVLRDGAALVGCFQRDGVGSFAVPRHSLHAWARILEARLLARVVLYSNRAWPETATAAVREVNAALAERDCPRQLDCVVEAAD